MNAMPPHPSEQLREQLKSETVAVPGVFNAFSARVVERAGFSAAYVTGAGLSASRALPDIGLLTMTEVVAETRQMAQRVNLPLLVDADTGFGDIHQVYRTVQELEEAGAAGIQLEDQILTKRCGHLPGKELITSVEMCHKISSAVSARRNPNLLIIARTDARGVEGLERSIERAKSYQAVGADAIFPEALESAEEFQTFAGALKCSNMVLVANMTEWGKSPYLSVKDFSQLGYHLVLFPMTIFRVMAKAMEEALQSLKINGTQEDLLENMQTRKELYDVLHYDEYTQFANRIRTEKPRGGL